MVAPSIVLGLLLPTAALAADFSEKLERERSCAQPSARLADALKPYRVVFLGLQGLPKAVLNILPEGKSELERLGQASGGGMPAASYYETGFYRKSWSKSADEARKALRKIYVKGGKRPLILIGNPASGADALLALLREPSLVTDGVVKRLFVPQGVMHGSPVTGSVQALCQKMFGKPLGICSATAMRKFDPEVALKAFQDAISKLESTPRAQIDQAVYLSTGFKAVDKMHRGLRMAASEMEKLEEGSEHDAITFARDQVARDLEGRDVGTVKGEVEADHWDLTVESYEDVENRVLNPELARQGESLRRAFIRAALMESLDLDLPCGT
jgi:hypothetical protein